MKGSLSCFDRQFPISCSYIFLQQLEKEIGKNLLNKWKILYLLIVKTHHSFFHDEDDYDDYNTPKTSRVNEIIFTKPPQINYELDD